MYPVTSNYKTFDHNLTGYTNNVKRLWMFTFLMKSSTITLHVYYYITANPLLKCAKSYSFRIEDLKNFIIQDGRKIIDKTITGTENMERVDNKLKLVKLKFSFKNLNKLSYKVIKTLSKTAEDFFHFIENLEKLINLQNYF